MISRNDAEKYINDYCYSHLGQDRWRKSKIKELTDATGLPVDVVSNIIDVRGDISHYSDFVLFLIISVLNDRLISTYFSTSEIKLWNGKKYLEDAKPLFLEYDAVEIDEGSHYICKLSYDEVIQLRDYQLLNYNEKTQRTLKRKIKDNFVEYKIDVNNSQVEGIKESMLTGMFISNTLTFNVNEEASLSYDVDSHKLKIIGLDMFDIIDGYHRFLALSRAKEIDNTLDGVFEVRIVQFSTSRCEQFIWQENQKYKMRKIDSDTMNQLDFGNKIAKSMNETPNFELYGEILRNGGLISVAHLANAINVIFMNAAIRSNKKRTKLYEKEVKSLLIEKLNILVNENSELLKKEWTFKKIVAAVIVSSLADVSNEELSISFKLIYQIMKEDSNSMNPFKKPFYQRIVKKFREMR